jgi:hypothetical protein
MPAKRSSVKSAAKKARPAVKKAKSAARKLPVEDLNLDYLNTGRKLIAAGFTPRIEESQMFGKPCFKINGKAFMSLFDGCVVFKLTGKTHEAAMKLKDSKLFDPSGTGRAMKEWVQVTMANKSKFDELAAEAMKYVKSTTK